MDESQRKQVADNVRSLMKDRHITQRELADRAGVSPNTVLALVKGRQLQPGTLRRILDALDIPDPSPTTLSFDGVPEDVQAFVRVVVKRVSRLPEHERERLLVQLYPRVISAGEP